MKINLFLLLGILLLSGCTQAQNQENSSKKAPAMFTPLEGKVKLMNLDPGHFHAALVQKTMYEQVDPVVHVYAPEGPEVQSYLNRIRDYNSRPDHPTRWEEQVYTGPDFLEKMLSEKPGNVMVVSGNNAKKTEYTSGPFKKGSMCWPTNPWSSVRLTTPCWRRPLPQPTRRGFCSMTS